MQKLLITGGNKLTGNVIIGGAKNSVLPLICATVILNGKSTLHNCPDLSDVQAALSIIEHFGLSYIKKGTDIEIYSKDPDGFEIPDELMRTMRSSVMFLGPVLSRCRRAVISLPGGCKLGPRPIDMHISALVKMGAKINFSGEKLEFNANKGLKGASIFLKFPSVGATENIIMAAALAKGTTRIFNAAREPEIVDLANFLNKCGAQIQGAGTNRIIIGGVAELGNAEHTVIPDRIEAATYMAAAAVTGGSITLQNVNCRHLSAVNYMFSRCGCSIDPHGNVLKISAPSRPNALRYAATGVYPGFPTDVGPMLMGVLTVSGGTSVIEERIFKNRFAFIDELKKFGAEIIRRGPVAVVNGKPELNAARCSCTDLRGGAALIIAALRANGTSEIGNLCHIKRGYQDIAGKLSLLGADISEVQR